MIIQYQMVLHENIHESNILWTRQVIFEKEQKNDTWEGLKGKGVGEIL